MPVTRITGDVHPFSGASESAYSTEASAVPERMNPATSKRPALGSRCSFRNKNPTMNPKIPTGRFT